MKSMESYGIYAPKGMEENGLIGMIGMDGMDGMDGSSPCCCKPLPFAHVLPQKKQETSARSGTLKYRQVTVQR